MTKTYNTQAEVYADIKDGVLTVEEGNLAVTVFLLQPKPTSFQVKRYFKLL